MNEVMVFGNNIIGGADGPTSIFLAGKISMGALIAGIVISLLICFFGLKLMRVLALVAGFCLGVSIGLTAGVIAGLEGTTLAIVVLACGVFLGAIAFALRRFGVFFAVFVLCAGAGFAVVDGNSMIVSLVVAVISLVAAILAAIFMEPIFMIATGIFGGLSAGANIAIVAGLDSSAWIGYGIGAALAVIGIIVQFMMHSRKVGKKEKVYAEEIKEKDSVESEVEKARNILEEDEEEE